MKCARFVFLAAGLLALSAAGARAQPVTDSFRAYMPANIPEPPSGGTGYNDGTWYYYPNTNWWNQWFYDDPPMPPPWWKKITYSITVEPLCPDGWADVAISWSTLEYPESGPLGPPPLPPLDPLDEERWIVREVVGPVGSTITGEIIIPDYNPEWINIDVRGENVDIQGTITHECIPEPATLSLLALGGALVAIRRRRR